MDDNRRHSFLLKSKFYAFETFGYSDVYGDCSTIIFCGSGETIHFSAVKSKSKSTYMQNTPKYGDSKVLKLDFAILSQCILYKKIPIIDGFIAVFVAQTKKRWSLFCATANENMAGLR